MEFIFKNQTVEPVKTDTASQQAPSRPYTFAELTIEAPPIHANMNKLIGVLFTRLDALDARLTALENQRDLVQKST
jgi:hypothetical protein